MPYSLYAFGLTALSLFVPLLSWAQPVAVVEYFTSEGCSGCPYADVVLSDLSEARWEGEVFFLSFHVDHFDTATWQDPFSHPLFSARQRSYTHTLGAALFTPQMVINGTDLRVGSRGPEVHEAITQALSDRASQRLALTLSYADAQSITIQYTVPVGIGDAVLNFALVEDERPRQSPPFSLEGHTLSHQHVVRGFQTVWAEPGQQTFTMPLPPSLQRAATSVVAYLQHPVDMRVLGAIRRALP